MNTNHVGVRAAVVLAFLGAAAASGGCSSSGSNDPSELAPEQDLTVVRGSSVQVSATCRQVLVDVQQPNVQSGPTPLKNQPFDDRACTERVRPPVPGRQTPWDGQETFNRAASLVIHDEAGGAISAVLQFDGSTAWPSPGVRDMMGWLNPTLAASPLRLTIEPEHSARRRDYVMRSLQMYPDVPGPAGFWLETLSTGERHGATLHLSHAATYYSRSWPGDPCPTGGIRFTCELDVELQP